MFLQKGVQTSGGLSLRMLPEGSKGLKTPLVAGAHSSGGVASMINSWPSGTHLVKLLLKPANLQQQGFNSPSTISCRDMHWLFPQDPEQLAVFRLTFGTSMQAISPIWPEVTENPSSHFTLQGQFSCPTLQSQPVIICPGRYFLSHTGGSDFLTQAGPCSNLFSTSPSHDLKPSGPPPTKRKSSAHFTLHLQSSTPGYFTGVHWLQAFSS
mmetsp:Transcript_42268/g.67028  ORF Transcript_42268/g.67028 Transcript_42268/m.67028 type:complete len:210 (+) Transcript_42268:2035-2664(+)